MEDGNDCNGGVLVAVAKIVMLYFALAAIYFAIKWWMA